jgi:hypothetical protein
MGFIAASPIVFPALPSYMLVMDGIKRWPDPYLVTFVIYATAIPVVYLLIRHFTQTQKARRGFEPLPSRTPIDSAGFDEGV